MLYLLRLFRRFMLAHAFEEGGAAAVVDTPAVETADPGEVADAAPAAAPAADAPTSMLDAITRELSRDEKGRFVGKDPAAADAQPGAVAAPAAAAVPAVPAAKPAEPKPADDDVTAMPEGLGQKAQERFQKLATANREATERIDVLDRQVSYIRDTFHQHSVKPEQFEQAASVIGMMNRGDLRGALSVLDQQRAQIAIALGEPLPGVDALSAHPDLREAVNGLEITEQRALELARLRQQTHAVEQRQQQANQQREQSQAAEREFTTAQTAVDAYCKRLAATDIDFPAIEAQLLPALPKLLAGVPPKQWPAAVQTQYELIKQAAGAFRRSSPSVDTNPLRATGSASPRQAPGSMFEAMFGKPEPRA